MKAISGEAEKKIKEAREYFYIPAKGDYNHQFESILVGDENADDLLLAFRDNINALVNVGSMPFSITYRNEISKIHQSIGINEALDNLIPEEESLIKSDSEIRKITSNKIKEYLETEDGSNTLFLNVANSLLRDYDDSSKDFYNELINQSVIQIWSTFEVFARDYIEKYFNIIPEKVDLLISNGSLKKRFDLSRIPYEIIRQWKFDLKNAMGSIVIDAFDCSDLLTIKGILKCIQDQEKVQDIISDDIWILFQTRHLLIHRRGIVDSGFIEKTGSKITIGEKIKISPRDIDKYVQSCIDTVKKMNIAMKEIVKTRNLTNSST